MSSQSDPDDFGTDDPNAPLDPEYDEVMNEAADIQEAEFKKYLAERLEDMNKIEMLRRQSS